MYVRPISGELKALHKQSKKFEVNQTTPLDVKNKLTQPNTQR